MGATVSLRDLHAGGLGRPSVEIIPPSGAGAAAQSSGGKKAVKPWLPKLRIAFFLPLRLLKGEVM